MSGAVDSDLQSPHTSGPGEQDRLTLQTMAFDACEIFVGPMSVEQFISEFVPINTKESRPTVKIPFGPRAVSENENEFASIPTFIDYCHHLILFTD